jgi:hypothetical protein
MSDSKVGTAFKTIQTDDWYRHGRHERLLGEISGNQLTHSGTAGFPTTSTLHPSPSLDETRKQVKWAYRRARTARQALAKGRVEPSGPPRALNEGPKMSDKSPRQGMTKKSGKSLKEKRVDKNAKSAAKSSAADAITDSKKR